MDKHNHEHVYPEECKIDGWRFYRARGGRVVWGLLLSGTGASLASSCARAVTSGSGR